MLFIKFDISLKQFFVRKYISEIIQMTNTETFKKVYAIKIIDIKLALLTKDYINYASFLF